VCAHRLPLRALARAATEARRSPRVLARAVVLAGRHKRSPTATTHAHRPPQRSPVPSWKLADRPSARPASRRPLVPPCSPPDATCAHPRHRARPLSPRARVLAATCACRSRRARPSVPPRSPAGAALMPRARLLATALAALRCRCARPLSPRTHVLAAACACRSRRARLPVPPCSSTSAGALARWHRALAATLAARGCHVLAVALTARWCHVLVCSLPRLPLSSAATLCRCHALAYQLLLSSREEREHRTVEEIRERKRL
jgi:hypothetical protein